MALSKLVSQILAMQLRVAVQAAAGHERDRVDDPRVGEIRPRGLREIERLHAGECLAPALRGLLAQAHVDLLLGHSFELPVVVEQAHGKACSSSDPRARHRAARPRAERAHTFRWPGPARPWPGPWMTRNHRRKPSAQIGGGGREDPAEHTRPLVVPGGAAHEDPCLVHAAQDRERPEQKREQRR